MKKKTTMDTITSKQKELIKLNEESGRALDIVTSTIHNLAAVNEKIDLTMNEIQEAKNKLLETENGLNKTRLNNTRIIEKFQYLIEG